MLRLYDTARGEVLDLDPRDARRLSMYVCGPTVYDLPHLGHGRYTLVWDVARRWFSFRGLEVRFVSNITDIDDNIINRALREGSSEAEVARRFEDEWWRAMTALGVARPDDTPHATQFVASMVDLIASFLRDDIAYTISDGVYFDTSRVSDYGLLAGQSLDSLRAGARVEASEEKRSPLDFALWKFAKAGEPSWPAPFGDGRPGWHTECVVMSLGLLGDGFDLHSGVLRSSSKRAPTVSTNSAARPEKWWSPCRTKSPPARRGSAKRRAKASSRTSARSASAMVTGVTSIGER